MSHRRGEVLGISAAPVRGRGPNGDGLPEVTLAQLGQRGAARLKLRHEGYAHACHQLPSQGQAFVAICTA